MARRSKTVISAATGTAAHSMSDGGALGRRIEEAMTQAVLDAADKGITDPDKIRDLKLKARERVKTEE